MKLLKMLMATWPITIVALTEQNEENQLIYNELIPLEYQSKRSKREVDEPNSKIFCLSNSEMYETSNPNNIEWREEKATIHRSYYKDVSQKS